MPIILELRRDRRIDVQDQFRQKVSEIPSQPTSWVWLCMPEIPVMHPGQKHKTLPQK
jgi:hypothetical protein